MELVLELFTPVIDWRNGRHSALSRPAFARAILRQSIPTFCCDFTSFGKRAQIGPTSQRWRERQLSGREIWAVRQMYDGEIPRRTTLSPPFVPYSHSIVPGGLLVTSYTTRLTPLTSLMMRVAVRPRNAMSKG